MTVINKPLKILLCNARCLGFVGLDIGCYFMFW